MAHHKRSCVAYVASIFMMCAMSATAVQASSLSDIQESGTIRVVTTSSSPPHGFLDPDTNQSAGVMIEVAEAVADHLGVTPEFTEVAFAGLISTLRSGRADLMSGPLFITEERGEQVAFTDPVYGWGEGLLVRTDNEQKYPNLAALSGNRVGTLTDSVQYEMVGDVDGVRDVRTYRDYVGLLQDLAAGRIDVAIVDPPSVLYQIDVHGLEGARQVEEYEPVNHWDVGMAVANGNPELLDAVNEALREMKASGQLAEILAGWDIENLMSD